eukprot:COSAG02_NODE_1329_length_13218_cov_16.986432_4_plen_275_part_00
MACSDGESIGGGESAIDEVAARLGVDPLLLPQRTVCVGAHRLTVHQNWLADTTPDNTGSACWPGSLLLAHYIISSDAESVRRAADTGMWLELGCGAAALPGTCLLRSCPEARGRLMFADRTQELLEQARANLQRNCPEGHTGPLFQLEWGADLPQGISRGGYSLCICAELLYDVSAVAPLLSTLDALLMQDGVAVFGHRERNGAHTAMIELAGRHGFEWVELTYRPWDDDSYELTQAEAEAWGSPLSILRLGQLRRMRGAADSHRSCMELPRSD